MWFLEQPLMVLFVGSILVAVSGVAWVQTQHPRALQAGLLSVVALVAGLALERWVVTPAEQVEASVFGIARALESNDVPAVTAFLGGSADELRQEVQTYLRLVTVNKISIKSNLKVTMSGSAAATARFNAVATVSGRGGTPRDQPVPRLLIVHFRLEQGQWRIVSYEAFDPRGEAFGGMAPGA